MIVTLEKEVEEPFDRNDFRLFWLTVFTDYEVSYDVEIETGRAILEHKEIGVRYEITSIEVYDFEGDMYSVCEQRRKYLVENLDDDTLKALQSFAEAHSGHSDDEIIEEARKSA